MHGCYDVIVLGAGVSGLAAARLSNRAGLKVLVVEQYASAGGNHITQVIDGMEFDVGSIFFHSGDSHFALFPELKEACVPARICAKKVNWFGRLSPYPLSFRTDILANGPWYVAKGFLSFAFARIRKREARSAADLLAHKLGPFFLRTTGLSCYMQRLTGLPPHQTARSFVDRRMRWVMAFSPFRSIWRGISGRFRSPLRRSAEPAAHVGASTSLLRPPGGFAGFYDRLVRQMRSEGVDFRFGTEIRSISRSDDADFRLASPDSDFRSKRLIATWPLRQVSLAAGLPAPNLRSVTLHTLMVAYTGALPRDAEVLFNFHPDGQWKRITLMSRLYGSVDGREYFSVECPCTDGEDRDPADLFRLFVTHVGKLKLFPGEFELLGVKRLENAYPIMPIGYERDRDGAVERLRAFGIELMGRQGRFDYIPHSTLAVQLVRQQFEHTPMSPSA